MTPNKSTILQYRTIYKGYSDDVMRGKAILGGTIESSTRHTSHDHDLSLARDREGASNGARVQWPSGAIIKFQASVSSQGQRAVTPIDAVVSAATGITMRSQSHDVFLRSQIVTPVAATIYYIQRQWVRPLLEISSVSFDEEVEQRE